MRPLGVRSGICTIYVTVDNKNEMKFKDRIMDGYDVMEKVTVTCAIWLLGFMVEVVVAASCRSWMR